MRQLSLTLVPITVLLLLAAMDSDCLAQKVDFCEQVSEQGTPIRPGSFFRIPENGGRLQVLVHSPAPLDGEKAILDLFFKESSGKEKFESSVQVDVSPDWMWFSRQLVFQRPGEYVIYAYGPKGHLIGTATVSIGQDNEKK